MKKNMLTNIKKMCVKISDVDMFMCVATVTCREIIINNQIKIISILKITSVVRLRQNMSQKYIYDSI